MKALWPAIATIILFGCLFLWLILMNARAYRDMDLRANERNVETMLAWLKRAEVEHLPATLLGDPDGPIHIWPNHDESLLIDWETDDKGRIRRISCNYGPLAECIKKYGR